MPILGWKILWWDFVQAKEEVEALEKKMQQLENELTQTQTNLETSTHNLEEKEKALQNVSLALSGWFSVCFVCNILFLDLHVMQTSLTECKWTGPIFRAICSMFWPSNKEVFQICSDPFVSRLMCLFPAAIQTQMIPKLKLVLALLKAVFPENGFWHICCCFALCTVKRRHLLQHDWRD